MATTTTTVSGFVTCLLCHREYPRKAIQCPGCATPNRPLKMAAVITNCHQCNAPLTGKSNVCGECGFAN